jgi:hypothetical protein
MTLDQNTYATVPSYAVGWFTLSLLNAGLAHAFGRSRFLWWLGSLFFGPLMTLILVLLGNDKK